MTELYQPEKTTSRRRSSNLVLRPFLKWAGGKRQLLPVLRQYIPKNWSSGSSKYFEPFIGAGAFLFDLQPKKALINDTNKELINCYLTIKDNPDELLELTREYQKNISKKRYYELRELDRDPEEFEQLSNVQRAARIIYLNKTCFNGLFRVNSQGQFNVPYGDNKNPIVADEAIIKGISKYLNKNKIEITSQDFKDAVSKAKNEDFIYFDPPYDPVSDSSSFTGYDMNGFGKEEQICLQKLSERLIDKGCNVLLSNSSTNFIKDLYSDKQYYSIIEVAATRHINSVGTGRGKINEVIIFSKYDVK
ncbi:MAG: DNA adenine methylase [Pseudanabaena sp. M135S2SP2A07QC]|nr:DNA adenine methylase [Pseudanabaena sp. M090S1SP2A07QC]MCA6505003.1 DNA adenine methylase [Pseudanabaena sp. M172S2SP2A07QC]MCA6520507.1 DNA adenine methylase [Pseudanabaena sp. M051S1SP2A07QC]MCA6524914.1 DNA adenine methylase [Pseudanabaena sp. M179S2SP2A07QC]MCA6529328.1 DNA adenine methylase [Pseudanabaena sp. M125S2SP2A07QC]MCA6535091.1 DNA adenine methylase [Pseudanabaena sp. M176S2SP2A07QC]MCA6539224.1 DNA adenine methylase [Pseudanabaena sp. M037S2SP2A07QC]MCA6543074.1 DNA adenin